MKLEEAQATYVLPGEATGKLVNRRIKTHLKKRLREKAELVTGRTWQKLGDEYSAEFYIEGSPARGNATLVMRAAGGCYGMGATPPPELKLGFRQRELFDS
jgi:hypothetical protein